jgi:hypothetical protein
VSPNLLPTRTAHPKSDWDFADLLVELCEAEAEFLLVGGWAVILHGHVRATDDMAVFVRASEPNSQRVFAALEAFGAPLRAHAVEPKHFVRESDAYRFGVAPLKVEILTKISGVSFDDARKGSKTKILPTSKSSNGRRAANILERVTFTCIPEGSSHSGAARSPFVARKGFTHPLPFRIRIDHRYRNPIRELLRFELRRGSPRQLA